MSAPTPAPDTPQGQMTPAQQTAQQIAAQAQQRQQIASLADALIPQTQPGAILSKGKIMTWETGFPPTVTIQLGGDTSTVIPAVRYLDSYTPTPGDTVLIAKQGSEILVIGKAHEFYSNQPAKNGWQPVSPQTTWNGSNNSLTPPMWRRVFDHGDQKIQFQGRVWRNGSNTGTTIFTLPVGYRPGIQRVLLAARENFGGLNEVQINVNTSGVVEVSGHTLAGPSNPGVDTNNVNLLHWHKVDHGGNGGDSSPNWTSDPFTGIFPGSKGYPNGVGVNNMEHRHTTNAHSHTASFPGWVSLDGLEFFL